MGVEEVRRSAHCPSEESMSASRGFRALPPCLCGSFFIIWRCSLYDGPLRVNDGGVWRCCLGHGR